MTIEEAKDRIAKIDSILDNDKIPENSPLKRIAQAERDRIEKLFPSLNG